LKELINRILADEESGRSRVAEAQEKAKKIRQQAEAESVRIVADGLKQAQDEAARLIAKVQTDMTAKKETEFAESDKTGKAWFSQKKKDLNRIADMLFDLLTRRTDAK
jgi:F0F1-type ATP synthase membrane subunit b/b'